MPIVVSASIDISSGEQLKARVAEYAEGRRQFADVNAELKEVKRTIERLGDKCVTLPARTLLVVLQQSLPSRRCAALPSLLYPLTSS